MSSALRVSVFSRIACEQPGGIEAMVRQIVPRLAAQRPGWEVRSVSAFGQVSRFNRIPFLGDLMAGFVLAWKSRSDDIAIVNGSEYAFARILIPRMRQRTLVVWHGTRAGEIPALVARMTGPVRAYLFLEIALQWFALFAPRHVAVSPSAAEEIRRTYGARDDLTIVLNGKSTGEATLVAGKSAGSAPSILWIGTNAHKKGLDIAIEAMRLVRERYPTVRLRVAGITRINGDRDDYLDYLGSISPLEIRREFACADAFIACSRYEACSVAVLEAMAFQVPIVAGTTVAWMLGDDPGLELEDVEGFAAALLDVLDRPESAARRAATIASNLGRFDWDMAAQRYVLECERLAGKFA